MAGRRIIKAGDLAGMFIHQDKKRGTIYYDLLSRKGYILTTSDVRTFTLYTAMLPLCVIISLLSVSLLGLSYFSAALIFIALYLLVAVIFRILFFYKLPVAENWKPVKNDNIVVQLARNYSTKRLIVLLLLLLILSILMPLYGLQQNYEGINLIAIYFMSALTIIGVILTVISIFIKNKFNY